MVVEDSKAATTGGVFHMENVAEVKISDSRF